MIAAAQTDRAADGPTRRCIVSGTRHPRSALLRFAVSTEGTVMPDLACRLPGRGIWVEPRRESLRLACDRNLFARAARRTVQPAEGLVDIVGDQLLRRCLDLLRLARRADQVVFGHDRVSALRMAADRSGHPGVLVTAVDASPRAVQEAERLAMAKPGVARLACLTADEMGCPFDRERVVHVFIKPGRLAELFIQEATRLAGMRPDQAQECGRR